MLLRNRPFSEIVMGTNDPLREALLKARGAGQTIVQIANSAGTSTKTVVYALKGKCCAKAAKVFASSQVDNRSAKGLVTSIVRLSAHVGLDPSEVISTYKIPKSSEVEAWIDNAKKAVADKKVGKIVNSHGMSLEGFISLLR